MRAAGGLIRASSPLRPCRLNGCAFQAASSRLRLQTQNPLSSGGFRAASDSAGAEKPTEAKDAPAEKTVGGAGSMVAVLGALGVAGAAGGAYYYQQQGAKSSSTSAAATNALADKAVVNVETAVKDVVKQPTEAVVNVERTVKDIVKQPAEAELQAKAKAEAEKAAAEVEKVERGSAASSSGLKDVEKGERGSASVLWAAEAAAVKAVRAEVEKAAEEAAAREAAEKTAAEAAARAAVVKEAANSNLSSVHQASAAAQQQREAALATLREALASKDRAAIEAALAGARKAHLGRCGEAELAESIVDPVRLIRDGLKIEELHEVLLLPEELRGLTEESAGAAERAKCSEMNAEQLRTRVVELSKYLAMTRLHARTRLEETLTTRLEAADSANLRSLEEALKRLAAERDEASARNIIELEVRLQQQHEDKLREVQQTAAQESQAMVDSERAQLLQAAEEAVLQERSTRLNEVVLTRVGLQKVEEILGQEAELVQRYQAQNSLAVALLGVEDAVSTGSGAAVELARLKSIAAEADRFSATVLSKLPKASQDLVGKGFVPMEPALRHKFDAEVEHLVSAAFAPPNSGFLGELVGRFFSKLYVLEVGDAAALESSTPSAQQSEATKNLAVLARAARTEPGLSTSLAEVEGSLTGLCRERASAWVGDMRHALLVRQALLAVKARAQCLSMAQIE